MEGYNRVTLMGNLTRDPELRKTSNGISVCDIGLAINRSYRDAEGERQEEVAFVDAVAWSRTAEVIDEHFEKGKPILIEGRLQYDQWENNEGERRSKLKVVIDRFNFVGDGPAAPAPQDAADAGGRSGRENGRERERDGARSRRGGQASGKRSRARA